jgi:hypothetical protein
MPVAIDGKFYVELPSYGDMYQAGATTLAAREHFGRDAGIKILEIGVLRGHHAHVMYLELSPSLMVLVDPWDMFGEETHDCNWADTWYRMQGLPEVVILKATSERAHSLLDPKLMFDYIYIDGDHFPDGFNLDLQLWKDRVATGGILAGHDFNFPNIEEEVHRVFGKDRVHNSATEDRTLGGEEWWVFM